MKPPMQGRLDTKSDADVAPPPAVATRLDRAVDAALASLGLRGPGAWRQGGVAVLSLAEDAFAIRAASARAAGRTLDLQYYTWRGDLTGMLMAREVLAAADRGCLLYTSDAADE